MMIRRALLQGPALCMYNYVRRNQKGHICNLDVENGADAANGANGGHRRACFIEMVKGASVLRLRAMPSAFCCNASRQDLRVATGVPRRGVAAVFGQRRAPQRHGIAFSGLQTVTIGLTYVGHDYIGHEYIGQNHICHNYLDHNCIDSQLYTPQPHMA